MSPVTIGAMCLLLAVMAFLYVHSWLNGGRRMRGLWIPATHGVIIGLCAVIAGLAILVDDNLLLGSIYAGVSVLWIAAAIKDLNRSSRAERHRHRAEGPA